MNRKLIISLSVAVIMSFAAAYADVNTTIYTDGIGRIHFLGRDGGNGHKYTNPAEQDLTRKLYEKTAGDVTEDSTYDQHPLKNYENTFPGSRFTTKKRYEVKEDSAAEAVKATVNTTKGVTDYSGQSQYGSTILNTNNADKEGNEVKTSDKKHWWNKKK